MTAYPKRFAATHCLPLALILLTTFAGTATAAFVRVARDGDSIAGGATLLDFSLPILNNAGDILVQARFDADGDGSSDGQVLLRCAAGGTVHEIARTGDVLSTGATISSFNTVGATGIHILADNGRAAFQVISMDVGGRIILSGVGGAPTVYLSEGDPVPGSTTGETVKDAQIIGYTDTGVFVYSYKPSRPGFTGFLEIWRGAARLAYTGHPYAGTVTRAFNRGWVTDGGDVLVSGEVVSPGVDPTVWFRPFEGELIPIVDDQTPAPAGSTFELGVYAGGIFYNGPSSLGFVSKLFGLPYGEDYAAFFSGGGTPTELLRISFPGPDGGTYNSVDMWDFNDFNESLIHATWRVPGSLTSYDELLRMTPTGLGTRIAAEAQPDPDATGLFGNFAEGAMNDAGQVAFLGVVKVGGTSTNALLWWDGQNLSTLAQEGRAFDGQVLTSVGFAGRVGGHINRSALNADGQVAFLAESEGQKAVYRYDPDSTVDVPLPGSNLPRIMLKSVAPNPFNPRTTITYSLSAPTRVAAVIYDLAGRAVRTLMDEPESAGVHRLVWNGVDDGGAALASGTYFCRISSPDADLIAKLVLLK